LYDIIRKREYFEWWDRGLAAKGVSSLKNIQDAWVMSQLCESKGMRIAEVGGGESRLLQQLKDNNSCVNIDKFEGHGNGPNRVPKIKGIKVIPAYMGDFDTALKDESFDAVFSISVLEHIASERLSDCFGDMARILKPGGKMLHAIDVYLHERPRAVARINEYRQFAEQQSLRLEWIEEPALGDKVWYHCDYAANSVQEMAEWNRLAPSPALRELRCTAQSCSLKMELVKK
jgi:SAM-dependent methyltransferase